MTQFKEKAGKDKEKASVGLYIYPILMAADILLYNAEYVPVGKDQLQHLEITRDIVSKFNSVFGDLLIKPEPLITELTGLVLGTDGQKMSKSKGNVVDPLKLIDNFQSKSRKIDLFIYQNIFHIFSFN